MHDFDRDALNKSAARVAAAQRDYAQWDAQVTRLTAASARGDRVADELYRASQRRTETLAQRNAEQTRHDALVDSISGAGASARNTLAAAYDAATNDVAGRYGRLHTPLAAYVADPSGANLTALQGAAATERTKDATDATAASAAGFPVLHRPFPVGRELYLYNRIVAARSGQSVPTLVPESAGESRLIESLQPGASRLAVATTPAEI